MRIDRLAALLVLLGGCFSPIYPEGLHCAEGDECPPGQDCVVGFCRSPDDPEPGDGGTIDGEPSKTCTAENALPAGASLTKSGTTVGGPLWNRPDNGYTGSELVCPGSRASDVLTVVPRQAFTFCNPGGTRRFTFTLANKSLQDGYLALYDGAGVPADTSACLTATTSARVSGPITLREVVIPAGGLVTVVVSGYRTDDDGAFDLHVEEEVMPTLDVAARRSALAEGTTADAMVVRLVPPATEPVMVAVETAATGGTASAADWMTTTTTLTFQPGETEHAVALTAPLDATPEGDETVPLRLATVSGARLGFRTGTTVAIYDQDSACTPIVPGTPILLDGTTQGGAPFTTPIGPCPNTTTGQTRPSASHGFCDRTMTARRVAVQVDGLDEDPGLTLTDPEVVLYSGAGVPTNTGTCLLLNNDGQGATAGSLAVVDLAAGQNLTAVITNGSTTTSGSYRLRISDFFIGFAARGTSVAETADFVDLPIELSLPAPGPVRVSYTVSGTATADQDYVLAAGELELAAGATTASLRVPILPDDVDEADETVIVRLFAPEGVVLGRNQHTVTIVDDDATPTVQFGSASSMVREGSSAAIPVTLSAKTQQTVIVMYLVTGGGARGSGIDYVLWPGMLTFAPGVDTVDLLVPVENDGQVESPETVVIGLVNPTHATLGATTAHTLTLVDP